MAEHSAVVGIYPTHTEAEAAVKALQQSGFDMQKLSIVGKDYHTEEHVIGYYTTSDRMQIWGKRGAFWGGFWGLLVGSGFFFIPGIGPLRRFLKKNFLIQGVGTGLIKMSYLGNTGWRSKRASTACIAAFPSEMPFW
jgi:hypothetical protein